MSETRQPGRAQAGYRRGMAEAYPSSRPEPPALRPESRSALHTGRPDDLAPSHADRRDKGRIAELEAEVRALREEAARLRRLGASATDHAIITSNRDGHITSWNLGAERILGYTEAEVLGCSGNIFLTYPDRAAGLFRAGLHQARKTGSASHERWYVRRDGNHFWASGTTVLLLDDAGQAQGFLTILRDRTDARAEVERCELLLAEMNNRIKNTFALVQAVAAQAGRHATAPADFLAAFGARLLALSRSHDTLIRAGRDAAPLRGVHAGWV